MKPVKDPRFPEITINYAISKKSKPHLEKTTIDFEMELSKYIKQNQGLLYLSIKRILKKCGIIKAVKQSKKK